MIRLAFVAGLALGVSGCGLPYYWQAVSGQIGLLRQRTPIDTALADANLDAEVKRRLSAVSDIRQFAVDRLQLPDNDSYTSYVDLDRSYVVWNVIAAEEFSVDPMRWCFPFAGCVAYRGYFDRAAAESYQARLAARGLDTYSGGASAYSTLGYFADPVLSTMLEGGDEYVAALLFHELAHQRLYIKDDSEFNEAFASTIEEFGMELWLRETQAAADLDRYRARLARRTEFGALVARQQSRLREIYAGNGDEERMRAAKTAAFALMRDEYEELKRRWDGASEYDDWFEQSMNNATLAAVATYRQWLPALKQRLAAVGLSEFYTDAERLADLSSAERQAWLTAWASGESTPGSLPES